MLKVVLIGVGGVSRVHIPAWDDMENAELTALCDIRPEQMEKYTDKRHYSDFDEMISNEKPDIVDICLPTYLHADYSVRAMNHGCNVICEKPVSLNKSDVDRVYSAAERNNVRYMVAHVLRFWPEYELIKQLYDTKKYGQVLSGSMDRLGCYPGWSWDGWMMDEKRSGLVPFDLHIHDLDFMVYTFGAPKKTSVLRSKRPEQDYISMSYEYDGFFITSSASWYASPYPFSSQFRFQFENAVVAFENGKMMIYERGGNVLDLSRGESFNDGEINVPKSNAYANEINYFADCVQNDKAPDKVRPQELKAVLDILKSI